MIFVFHAGLIRTKSRIDYEKVRVINFNVTATDTGIPQLTSTAQVHVNIININDNTPAFNESSYHLNVYENAMQRTSIGFVHADDADEGTYRLNNCTVPDVECTYSVFPTHKLPTLDR